ncbi:cilia- and flagella-associated protein 276 isoform X3 [Petromyzon marinus]|uniref:cilia- and flagella-associated protein 276 isoform X3 n=1 Tax=Petromyzon marinus TaxID=7757 RepID=UPI003F6EDCB7
MWDWLHLATNGYKKGDRAERGEFSHYTKTEAQAEDSHYPGPNLPALLRSKARRIQWSRPAGPAVPRDSLDFVLQSLYDHHSGFLQGKNETLVQRETLDSLDGWALKTRVEENPDSGNPSGLPLRRFTVPNKETIHAIAGAIQSHHSAATNRGYSRKQDGGFYCT